MSLKRRIQENPDPEAVKAGPDGEAIEIDAGKGLESHPQRPRKTSVCHMVHGLESLVWVIEGVVVAVVSVPRAPAEAEVGSVLKPEW